MALALNKSADVLLFCNERPSFRRKVANSYKSHKSLIVRKASMRSTGAPCRSHLLSLLAIKSEWIKKYVLSALWH